MPDNASTRVASTEIASPHVAICRKSGQEFSFGEDDLLFLERVSPTINGKLYLVPPPTLAPDLRAMRRMAWNLENR